MKKLPRASELMWVMGIVIVAFGIALCDKADLGVSMIAAPAFIVNEAVSAYLPGLTVGMTEYIIQGLLLALMCIIIGRFRLRYLLAFGVSVIYGSVLDLFLWLLSGVTLDAVWLRWVMLILGDAVTALNLEWLVATVDQSHLDLSAIVGVDHADAVGEGNAVFDPQTASACDHGNHVTRFGRDGNARGDQRAFPGCDRQDLSLVNRGAKIHGRRAFGGVFGRGHTA